MVDIVSDISINVLPMPACQLRSSFKRLIARVQSEEWSDQSDSEGPWEGPQARRRG